MLTRQILAIVAPTVARSLRRWIFHLGGLGFIPLGLLDSSVIPLPGSMDVLTIVLSTHQRDLWFYYALMATTGSVIGGYVTYRLAHKGGKETLERKFPAKRLKKGLQGLRAMGLRSHRRGGPIASASTYGAICLCRRQYSVKKFLVALTLGRIVPYSLLGYPPIMGAKCSR